MAQRKTYKREIATVLLAILFGLFLWSFLENDPMILEGAKFLTLPIFTFAGGAFALDAKSKQLDQRSDRGNRMEEG